MVTAVAMTWPGDAASWPKVSQPPGPHFADRPLYGLDLGTLALPFDGNLGAWHRSVCQLAWQGPQVRILLVFDLIRCVAAVAFC